jgi:hypothetical protein
MTTVAAKPHVGRRTAILAGLWFIAYWAARFVLENRSLATSIKVSAALFPVPIFALFLWSYVAMVRAMDELERRIHLEALGIAYSLATLLLMTLALMRRAVNLRSEDWSYAHVWIFLPIFYFLSVGIVTKRYHSPE